MIRVFLADDHSLVREGLDRIVRGEAAFDVVGTAADADGLLLQLVSTPVDVLLLDISMPGPGFPELMAQLRERFPAVKVLVVSMHPEVYYAERALRIGASGYVSKRQSVTELTQAIFRVHAGGTYVSKSLDGPPARSLPISEGGRLERLSPREFEILMLLARGGGITEIATLVGLSPKTISTYRTRLLGKLGLSSNAELVRYAIENDLLG